LDLETLLVPLGNANNHVEEQCASEAVKRAVWATVAWALNCDYAFALLDLHVAADALAELALWPLDGDPFRCDLESDA